MENWKTGKNMENWNDNSSNCFTNSYCLNWFEFVVQ
jgi:hypothetical protein